MRHVPQATKLTAVTLGILLGGVAIALAATNFSTFVSSRSGATQPLGASDWIPVYQGGTTTHIAGSLLVDLNSVQNISNKNISDTNNTLSVNLTKSVTGVLPFTNGGLGLNLGTSGGVLCFNSPSSTATSGALTANAPVIGGGSGVCPGVGSTTGSGTLFVTGSGSYTSGHGLSIDGSGHVIDNSNAVFANLPNSFVQQQTFTSGTVTPRTAPNATDTLDTSSANTSDCGKKVYYTSVGSGSPAQVNVTLPATGVVGCTVTMEQANTGRVVPTAAAGATLTSVHGFTGTFNGVTATIAVSVDTNAGGSAAHYSLTGDGQ